MQEPAHVELLREFANTLDAEDGSDELTSPSALDGWLRRADLLGPRRRSTQADLRTALDLRAGLREQMTGHHSGLEPADPDLGRLAQQLPVRLTFDQGGPRLAPHGSGVDAALSGLLVAVADAVADGSWPRLKLCPAEDCRWAFFDTSKNRSRTWCAMGVCGNRAKTRAYRSRHREGTGR